MVKSQKPINPSELVCIVIYSYYLGTQTLKVYMPCLQQQQCKFERQFVIIDYVSRVMYTVKTRMYR